MPDLSYQLYSSREFPPLDQTLNLLASLGYRQVEGYGPVLSEPEKTAAALKASGLTMPTAHVAIDDLERDPAKVLETANILGIKALYCPYLVAEARPTDGAGYRSLGERLARAGAPIVDAGLIFGWHNHDFEFIATADGAIPMQEIFTAAPTLSWEADLAWIVRGGADPFAWIRDHGDRISSIHIKDIATEGQCADEDGWADVGEGTMDWAGLLAAVRQTNAQFLIMEHDKPSDHERFASRSFTNVSGMLAS